MLGHKRRDFRELCEAASKEQDPEKLRALLTQLIKVLDERNGLRPEPATGATETS